MIDAEKRLARFVALTYVERDYPLETELFDDTQAAFWRMRRLSGPMRGVGRLSIGVDSFSDHAVAPVAIFVAATAAAFILDHAKRGAEKALSKISEKYLLAIEEWITSGCSDRPPKHTLSDVEAKKLHYELHQVASKYLPARDALSLVDYTFSQLVDISEIQGNDERSSKPARD